MSSVEARFRNAINVTDENMKPGVAIFTFSILIFTCLLGVFIAIYALWRIFSKNAKQLKNVDSTTVNTAASCIILHALTVLFDPIGYWFFMANNESAANIIWLIWDVLWTLSKLNLYFVYIYRCYITFKHTKYAYSPLKVYIPLTIAWILQLCNLIIFLFHDLDNSSSISVNDINNPLSNNLHVIIAASVYLFLDCLIVLAVVCLFIYPIIRLMSDLRTKSEQIMTLNDIESENLMQNHANNGDIAVQNEADSSSSELTMTPHSPTKMGAAYYNKYKKNKNVPLTPMTAGKNSSSKSLQIQAHKSNNSTTLSINTKFKMKKFVRLPCPEDEEKELEHFSPIIWNEKQMQILNTGTRLALLSVISLSSGFIYQFLWILSIALGTLGNFSYTWGIDTVINIVCIYLSFEFAVKEYDILCMKCCHCHNCCFKCVGNMAKRYNVSHN